jgi:hypothetical protein
MSCPLLSRANWVCSQPLGSPQGASSYGFFLENTTSLPLSFSRVCDLFPQVLRAGRGERAAASSRSEMQQLSERLLYAWPDGTTRRGRPPPRSEIAEAAGLAGVLKNPTKLPEMKNEESPKAGLYTRLINHSLTQMTNATLRVADEYAQERKEKRRRVAETALEDQQTLAVSEECNAVENNSLSWEEQQQLELGVAVRLGAGLEDLVENNSLSWEEKGEIARAEMTYAQGEWIRHMKIFYQVVMKSREQQ